MSDKNNISKAKGLARTIPKPPNKPIVFKIENNPSGIPKTKK
jgi:hypothetical protein